MPYVAVAGAFRFYVSEWLTGGIHLLILAFAWQADSPEVWPYALAAAAAVSFFAWRAAYRRYRKIHDIPTSRVASAAQGYVELFGRSEQLPGDPLAARLSGVPCCWFRYHVERKGSGDKWVHEDSGVSNAHFLLVDESGECVISPEGAEVLTSHRRSWSTGDRRFTEWLLLPKGVLYALGEFRTEGGANAELDEQADVSATLADWKRDTASLLERFDLDRDGVLDLREWELARLQARREVRQRHAEIRARDGVHIVRKPRDGRLFLLANELPERLGRRFALWSAVHLTIFFLAGSGAFLLLV